MKIIIFGANSFIGRNLIYCLNSDKTNLLTLYDYQDNHLDNVDVYKHLNPLDRKEWESIDLKCDLIYFFIGMTGTEKSLENYNQFININEITLLNLLDEYIKQKSNAKIIFPSSRLVYKGSELPIKESDEKETKTVYAANKLSCENYLKLFSNAYGIKYCVLRICVPFGTLVDSASSYGSADFFINKAISGHDLTLYGDGEVRRTFTFIGDLCTILMKVGLSEKCTNDVYNVGGCSLSLKELATVVSEKFCVKTISVEWPLLAKKLESGSTVFDSSKLDNLINVDKYVSVIEWIESL